MNVRAVPIAIITMADNPNSTTMTANIASTKIDLLYLQVYARDAIVAEK